MATANILGSSASKFGGKDYYLLSVLARIADGDEGGKHQLITATVDKGKLYICKAQAGDTRGGSREQGGSWRALQALSVLLEDAFYYS